MKIAINIPIIGKEEISAVTSILRNGALTSSANQGGKYVQDFEKLTASFVKSKYVIAVNSGTAALQAALYALDIKNGDEVLVPSFTFVATANAVVSPRRRRMRHPGFGCAPWRSCECCARSWALRPLSIGESNSPMRTRASVGPKGRTER